MELLEQCDTMGVYSSALWSFENTRWNLCIADIFLPFVCPRISRQTLTAYLGSQNMHIKSDGEEEPEEDSDMKLSRCASDDSDSFMNGNLMNTILGVYTNMALKVPSKCSCEGTS